MSAEIVPTGEQIAAILAQASELGFRGWGGECGQAALAINEVIFGGAGILVAALNDAFASKGRWVGHVAVSMQSLDGTSDGPIYWDADGKPKDDDDLLSWGMLDHQDVDYAETARDLGLSWTEEASGESALFEVSDAEVREHFDLSGFESSDRFRCQVVLLTQAREIVLGVAQTSNEVHRGPRP